MSEQLNPWDLLQPQDVTSRHRGAKPPRRCELLGEISLLSPAYLLSFERWPFHAEPPDHYIPLSCLLGLYASQSSTLMLLHSTYGYQAYWGYLWKPPLLFWRRPPQSNYPPCNVPRLIGVRLRKNEGWYFKVDSTKASASASKSPTYPTHHSSRINAKL